jgi:hypothetical protein
MRPNDLGVSYVLESRPEGRYRMVISGRGDNRTRLRFVDNSWAMPTMFIVVAPNDENWVWNSDFRRFDAP